MIKNALAKVRRAPLLALLAGSGLILAAVTLLPAAAGDTAADSELGQIDFSHSTVDFVRAQGFALSAASPAPGIAIDPFAGCVYVSDQSNNRVLGWRNLDNLQNGDAADFVIGQQDFYSNQADSGGPSNLNLTLSAPAGVAVDPAGNLYVADNGNQRVTEYNSPCIQPPGSFFSAANTIPVLDPWGVATDTNGDLFVTDTKNNRVYVYDNPLTSPKAPDGIIGQNSLTGMSCNQGGATPTANSLCTPYGLATDPVFGTLFVADTGNNRVVAFVPTSPGTFGNNPAAAIVLGQHTFTSNTSGCGLATNSMSLCAPRGVAVDNSRNLYVADTNNNRVTEYAVPSRYTGTTPEPASLFFGQSNKAANSAPNDGGPVSANGLWTPAGVTTDGSNLWVLDNHNYRAIEFNETAPSPSNITADLELGQFDFVHSTPNFVDGAAYSNMSSVVVDRNSTPQHLYVVDSKNNRVLGYKDATSFKNGAPADLVIGQPDPYTTICNSNNLASSAPSDLTLCLSSNPNGDAEGGAAAVDSQGNLWVSDTGNSRILEFPSPFSFSGPPVDGVIAGEPATVVLGQPNADTTRTGSGCPAASRTNLCAPAGLAFDSSDNLYVADFGLHGYNRVVEFDAPGTVGTNNQQIHLVLGQGDTGNNYAGNSCNQGNAAPTGDFLCEPMTLAIDLHNNVDNVYVADFGNNRVVEYDNPLSGGGGTPGSPGSAGDVTADLVFGQGSGNNGDFTDAVCGDGASGDGPITKNSLCNPAGITVDPFGSVYIADQRNNRILGFAETSNPPANVTPGIVFGQTDYTSGSANQGGSISSSSLNLAVIPGQQDGLATDAAGDLLAVDAGNIRLLDYNGGFLSAPTPTGSESATPTDTATATTTPTPTVTPSPVDDSLIINPKSITFPKELFIGLNGVTSPVKKVTLKVPKKGPPITVVDMVAKPPFAVDLSNTTCQANVEIAAGAKCEIGVTYTPTQVGKQNGAMTIVNNTTALHKIPIVLTGTGKMGKLKLKPAKTVSFAKTSVGATSAPVTVTLTNDNAIPMPISGISVDSGEFLLDDPNNCSSQNIAPQGSCAVTLTFTPSASGKQTGTLTIGEPAPNPAQTLKLKGTGE